MITIDNVLDELVQVNDFGPYMTVRKYFAKIALAVVEDGEGFSGKRPFGNSGWLQSDVCYPIAERHYPESEVDERVDEIERLVIAAFTAEVNGS